MEMGKRMKQTKKEIVTESACGFVIEQPDKHIEVFGKDFQEVKKTINLVKKMSLIDKNQ